MLNLLKLSNRVIFDFEKILLTCSITNKVRDSMLIRKKRYNITSQNEVGQKESFS